MRARSRWASQPGNVLRPNQSQPRPTAKRIRPTAELTLAEFLEKVAFVFRCLSRSTSSSRSESKLARKLMGTRRRRLSRGFAAAAAAAVAASSIARREEKRLSFLGSVFNEQPLAETDPPRQSV